jgi:hypothetical protein
MTTQLQLYNGAALHLGERRLVALTDDNELRRSLDDVWEGGDIKDWFLEQGAWNFAMRAVELTYSPSITPDFGYEYAFDKPSDWIRTAGVSSDEYFRTPLDYMDEQDYLFASIDTIYVRYVSNDSEYGYDLTRWPPTFVEWCKSYLAYKVALRVTGSATIRDTMYKLQSRLLTEARSRDAMNDAISYPPSGTWTRSRLGKQGDRGSRSNLIG